MSKLMPWGANYTVTAEIGPSTNFFTLLPEVTRTNLVSNPNFETNVSGWGFEATVTFARSTADAYSGTASGLVTITNNTGVVGINNLSNRGPATAGLSYTASTYVRLNAGTAFPYYVALYFYDAGGSILSAPSSTATTMGSTWERKSVTATAPANTVTVGMGVFRSTALVGTCSFYADAIMIEQASSALPYFDGTYANAYTGYGLASQKWNGTANASTSTSYWYSALTRRTNLLTNPNFQTNTTGWGANSTNTIAISSAVAKYGTNSLISTSAGGANNGIFLNPRFPVVQGAAYSCSGWFYVATGQAAISAYIRLSWWTAVTGGSNVSNTDSTLTSIPAGGGWIRVSVTGTAPATATYCVPLLFSNGTVTTANSFHIDGVIFEQASSALPFFDGTDVDDYSGYAMQYYKWDGTANASTSSGWWYVGDTRTNLVTNPSIESSLSTGWTSAQSSAIASQDFAYKGTWSLKTTMSNTGDSNLAAILATFKNTGTHFASAYFYIPTGSTLAGRTISIGFEGGTVTATSAVSTPATLVAGSWVRASYSSNITALGALGTTNIVARLSGTLSTAVGQIIYSDAFLLEQSSTLKPYFDAVLSDTYTGYTNYGATWNGTANLSTSTRKWRLTSAITNPVLDGNWYLEGKVLPSDITDRVQDIVITRGRNDPFQDVTTGKANLLLVNNDRALDPVNTASPYYSPTTGTSGVTLKRKVVIYYESTAIFTGLITDIDITYAIGPNNITISDVTFEVSDVLSDLASRTVEEYYPTPELTGARIAKILALPEINYTGTTSLDAGTVQCLDDPIADQTNCLSALQTVARTEQGYLFAKGDNTLRFSNRVGPSFGTPSVFADDGTGVPYENLSIVFGEETLYNRIVVTAQDSIYSGVAQDLTSQSRYGIKTLSVSGLLFSDDDALKLAQYFLNLYSAPSYRFNDMQLKFAGQKVNTTNQAIIMALDLGSKIRIKKTYISGTPSSVTQDAAIELIKHHITPTVHEIQFSLAPALTVFPLVLDDAVYGLLDSTNALVA